MARSSTSSKEKAKAKSKVPAENTCRRCDLSFDYHERTAYPPHELFLCKCPHEEWSQFLDHPCVNGHFIPKAQT